MRDIERYGEGCKLGLPVVGNLHGYLAACHLLYQEGATFQDIQGVVGVAAALIAEGGIRLQLVASRGLADAHRVEIRTLEEHIRRLLRDTRVQTAEHARDTHRLFLVAYH